jgi:hypothetical protein
MTWFYTSNGTQSGPITQQELAAKVQSGEVRGTDLIWKEGMSDWLPLNQVPGFSGGVVNTPSQFGMPMAQPSAYASSPRPHVTNYLWQSIVVTLLCCMPFGIVAIVFAAKVDGLVASGDIAGAEAASKTAKLWVNLAAGLGLAVAAIYIVLIIIGAAAGSI